MSNRFEQGNLFAQSQNGDPAPLDWYKAGRVSCRKCGRVTHETNLGECKECRGALWLSTAPDQLKREEPK
jgi:hypothetical protein